MGVLATGRGAFVPRGSTRLGYMLVRESHFWSISCFPPLSLHFCVRHPPSWGCPLSDGPSPAPSHPQEPREVLCPGPQLLSPNFCQARGPQRRPITPLSCCLVSRPHNSLSPSDTSEVHGGWGSSLGTTAPWPVGLAPLSASPSLVLGGVCAWCPRLPRSLHWDLGLPAATPSLQMPRVLTLILAPFAGSAASSDLGAQASVLAPQEPSDPGLVLFHPTTATSPQLHSLGPGGQGGHPESGLGQIRGSAGLSAQPCPLRPPTSPSAVCPG